MTRFDYLRTLKPGWLDGAGIVSSKEGIDWLEQMFDKYYPKDLEFPLLYPTAEGWIQIVWRIGEYEASIEVSTDTHQGTFVDEGNLSGWIERQLDLNDVGDWQWLINRIKKV
jgi:hypothetical protein